MMTHGILRARRLELKLPPKWLGSIVLLTLLGFSAVAADQRVSVADPKDMADSSGDIRSISAWVKGDNLCLSMTVEGVAAPSVDQTPVGMNNRYYYHWLLDTDNNPATGRSNSEYEGTPTGVTTPIGVERTIQVGWRNGAPDGIQIYDPINDAVLLATNFTFQASGNTLTAIIPFADLGLTRGQTIAFSAFQEGSSDGWAVDWMESATLALSGLPITQAAVTDPMDMADSSGDIRGISAHVEGQDLLLTMTVEGVAAPSTAQTPVGMNNRYYYHWLLDTDNNPATGRSNSEYEGTPTGVTKPIGVERTIQIGWRNGAPDGVQVYDPLNDAVLLLTNFTFQASGNTLSARIPLADLGLIPDQTIAISAFQEGSSDGWAVDWMESQTVTLTGPGLSRVSVADAKDMADSSGDIRSISAHVEGGNLMLSMTVEGVAAPSIEQTPVGMNNRYYYHWLLDTDNNPATGRSNSEYEGTPTGVAKPIGVERTIQVGWRNGAPDGVQVYDPINDAVLLLTNFTFQASGNTLTAVIPLADLGLTIGQTIAISAFQEGSSDGWAVDWMESQVITLESPTAGRMKIDGQFTDWADASAAGLVTSIDDPQDMADSSGDMRQIQATVEAGYLYLRMKVQGVALPSVDQTPVGMVNRYYYHWLLDTDNNPATGRSNSEYEGSPTGVVKPIGVERTIELGWRNGAPDGVVVYDPLNDAVILLTNYEYSASGDSVEARLKLADLGLVSGQTIAISGFQEGASDGWAVDWMESKTMTLEEAPSGMSLDNVFSGNAYGYKITVTDGASLVVDAATVAVRMDSNPAQATVTKAGAVTTVVGVYPSLLTAGSIHKVSLSLKASGQAQAKDYVYKVDPYSVLPLASSLKQVNTNNKGFVVHASKISFWQISDPAIRCVHSNIAALAELQLAGKMKDPGTGAPYYNEVEQDITQWVLTPATVTDPVNWYEYAPAEHASLNFTNDLAFPKLDPGASPWEGVAMDILTYVELSAGYHKLGLYTEGGHAAYAGLTNTDPVLSLVESSPTNEVPSYYARNQYFNVVAPEPGYYPLRVLFFQSRKNQEAGLMFELFSETDRTLHLMNDATDPKALRTFRAGVLVNNTAVTTPVTALRSGSNLVITYTGMLQWASDPYGPWNDFADASMSPVTIAVEAGSKFFRSRSY